MARADSGTSKNYWRPQDISCLTNVRPFIGSPVTLPDCSQLKPSQQGTLPLSANLSLSAKTATVLPHLTSASLISM